MTAAQKTQITHALMRYIDRFATVQDALATLQGISLPTVNTIKSGRTSLVSNKTWYQVAAQVGFYCGDWRPADTHTALHLRAICTDARYEARPSALIAPRGWGKTYTAVGYTKQHEHVYYVCGSVAYNRLGLIHALLQSCGLRTTGDVREAIKLFGVFIKDCQAPLVIVDDAYLLRDRALHLLTQLITDSYGEVGWILLGTEQLAERVAWSTNHNGLFHLIGKSYHRPIASPACELVEVCAANGVYEREQIARIRHTCSRGGMHGVQDALYQYKQLQQAA
jgi:hypothetical protein